MLKKTVTFIFLFERSEDVDKVIIKKCSDMILSNKEDGGFTAGELSEMRICIRKIFCCLFVVNDKGGDRICCDMVKGYYQLGAEGKSLSLFLLSFTVALLKSVVTK